MNKLFSLLLLVSSVAFGQTVNGVPNQAVLPSTGVWQHQGGIISPTIGQQNNATEPSLIYEGNPQIITSTTGSVYKMWWTCGFNVSGLCYAESPDMSRWYPEQGEVVIAAANPGPAHGYVFHYGSTYYYYTGNAAASTTSFNIYTSSDGVTWTLAHSGVLTVGTSGQWDSSILGNMYVIPSSGTWLMMYEAGGSGIGAFAMGVASSADQGVTWTKYGGNPVIEMGGGSEEAGGPEIHLINGLYYVWGQCSTSGSVYPDDICRWHSPTFLSNSWVVDNGGQPVFRRASQDEGIANSIGQVADPSMVEVNGSVFMAYEGVYAQNGTSPYAFRIKFAKAPMTFAELVQTNEGNATEDHAAGAFNSLDLFHCVYWDDDFGRVPCPNDTGQFLIGTMDIQGGSTSPSFAQNLYNANGTGRYIVNGAASFFALNLSAGNAGFLIYPNGTAGATLGSPTEAWEATTNGLILPYITTSPSTNPICPNGTGGALVASGCSGGDTITSPNSTLNVGGSSSATTLDAAPGKVCIPGAFATQTDAATVTWAIGSSICANASLTFTAHSGSRTLNLTGLVNGGSYVLWIKQDSTGGEGLTLGSGCTWKVGGGGSGAITPSTGASVVDVLAFTYDGTNCYANFRTNFN